MKTRVIIGLTLSALLLGHFTTTAGAAKPRVIIMSDIGGREPDDQESFVRLLLYSNELDLVGLIGANSQFGAERGDLGVFERIIDVYAQVRPNLLVHADGYPEPAYLKSILREGRKGKVGMDGVGNDSTTPGSRLIIEELKKPDDRPLWVLAWGGINTLSQALWDLREETEDDAQLAALVAKLRIYDIAGQDDSGAWIANQFPDVFYIRSGNQFKAFSYRRDWTGQPCQDGDLSLVNAGWYSQNVQSHHPYGRQYPNAVYMFEGDTPSFLYLVDNGLNVPEYPSYGGWGGRFTAEKVSPADRYLGKPEKYRPAPMHNNAADRYVYRGQERTNIFTPLWRWRQATQHDFAARMDWTMTGDFTAANHPPTVVVDGDRTTGMLTRTARPGETITLSAEGTTDADGDKLHYHWWWYPEPGNLQVPLAVEAADTAAAKIHIPTTAPDAAVVHVILAVTDDGEPPLTRYRRIVIVVDGTGQVRRH